MIMLNANIKMTKSFRKFIYNLSSIYERIYSVPDKFSYCGISNLYFVNKKRNLSDIPNKIVDVCQEFELFLNKIESNNKKIFSNYIDLANQARNLLKSPDNKTNLDIICHILKHHERMLIKTCISENIKIDSDFFISNYTKINVTNLIYIFFPVKEYKLKPSQFKLIDSSALSTTHIYDSKLITKLISQNIKSDTKNLTIIDGTSNIGGNVWSFAEKFKKVYAVEIDKLGYEALKYNMNSMGFTNIEFFNIDFIKLIPIFNTNDVYKSDVLFLDPPWEGKIYQYKDNVSLFMSSQELVHVLLNAINYIKPTLIVLKLPNNYNLNNFHKITTYTKLIQYKLKKYQLIILNFKKY